MMKRNYTNLLPASVFVLSASCATLTDEQQYEREDRFVQAVDQFRLKKTACKNSGGVIWIQRTTASKMPRPRYTRREYESATCVRHGNR